jgi:DNA-binding PadR family transcriptional regulator
VATTTSDRPGWAGEVPGAWWFATAARQLMEGGPPPGPWGGQRHRQRARPVPGFGGPPFGWPPGWFPSGAPVRARRARGDVRAAVLVLLAEQPMHGYQIITELAERSRGAWQPSPGSIYPTLQQLADEGLVTVAESDGRRTFSLTDAGRREVERAAARGRSAPWEQMAEAEEGDSGARDLRAGAMRLMAAVMQVAVGASEQQIDRAEQLLSDCRRALYRLLAEEESADGAVTRTAPESADATVTGTDEGTPKEEL